MEKIDFLSMKDFNKEEILTILKCAKDISTSKELLGKNKIVASLFFEPSTRTRLSFTAAAYKLGCNVLGFDSPDATSATKGESLRDTIRMVDSYADVIVMRHPKDGAARYAADFATHPVVNAGDGSNEHPSQTLLDLYTILDEQGTLENRKIAFVGDLKYGRTVHSLTKAMSNFSPEFIFVAPNSIQIPEYILNELKVAGIKYTLLDNYKDVVKDVDVLYITRIQRERFDSEEEYEKVKNIYSVEEKDLLNCSDNLIILHPLPRVNEINLDVDNTKYAKYFKQAANGVPTRMGILAIALGVTSFQKEPLEKKDIIVHSHIKCLNTKCITQSEKTENKSYTLNGKEYCYYCNREI